MAGAAASQYSKSFLGEALMCSKNMGFSKAVYMSQKVPINPRFLTILLETFFKGYLRMSPSFNIFFNKKSSSFTHFVEASKYLVWVHIYIIAKNIDSTWGTNDWQISRKNWGVSGISTLLSLSGENGSVVFISSGK